MATSFEIKLSKSNDQQTVKITQQDDVDLSGVSAIVASVYTDDLSTADNTHTFTATQLSNFQSNGEVEIAYDTLLGASPADEFYTVELNGDSGSYVSNKAGVGITLEASAKVYSKQLFTSVYSQDFRVDKALHVAHMLLEQMNAIEWQDYSLQKRIDFIIRLAHLKEILDYS